MHKPEVQIGNSSCSRREQATQSGLCAGLIHISSLLPCHPALESTIQHKQNWPKLFKALVVDRGFRMNFRLRTREAAVRRLGLTLLACVIAGFTASCAGLNGNTSTGQNRVAISP